MKDILTLLVVALIVIIGWKIFAAIVGFALSLIFNLLIIALLVLVVMALFKYVTSSANKT